MFGSGDDKKTPQPAPRADTPETVDQAASESVAKPVKKGLFSWFSKKNAEPQTPEPSAAESTAPAAETSQPEVAPEQVSTVVEPHAEPAALNDEPEPDTAAVEQVAAAVEAVSSTLVSSEPVLPVESPSESQTVSPAALSEPKQTADAEPTLAATTASSMQNQAQADAQVVTEPAQAIVAESVPAPSEPQNEPSTESLPSVTQTPELTTAPVAESAPAQRLESEHW